MTTAHFVNPVTFDPARVERGGVHPMDVTIAKAISEHLLAHYPGHLWAVECNSEQGVVNVKNLALSDKVGFRIKLGAFGLVDAQRKAVEAGGQLLEAYGQPRGAVDHATLADAKLDTAAMVDGWKPRAAPRRVKLLMPEGSNGRAE